MQLSHMLYSHKETHSGLQRHRQAHIKEEGVGTSMGAGGGGGRGRVGVRREKSFLTPKDLIYFHEGSIFIL